MVHNACNTAAFKRVDDAADTGGVLIRTPAPAGATYSEQGCPGRTMFAANVPNLT